MNCHRVFPLFVIVCTIACFNQSAAGSQPHIVVLIADDLGWGDVGFHGSRIKTPHIDRLAEQGTRLNQFYVQPVCSPTRGAFLTGRYPMRLGLQCGVVRPWAQHGLPLDERTLPQALQAAGYVTAICGKWHLGHVTPDYLPTRRGFTLQYGHYNGALDYFTHIRDGGHDWHRNDQPVHDEGYATDLIARAAVQIIADHDPSTPLFLYVPFNAPHTPLQAPETWIRKYDHFKQTSRKIYAAMVACMDDAVGQITNALRVNGFSPDQTLIFFCSDNGGIRRLGSNRELRDGKGSLYEGGVRVPAVAVWPGRVKPGLVVDQPVHITDLYPTLLKLAGASNTGGKTPDGQDIWPVIASGQPSPHQSILLNATPFHGAVRAGDWKLIHNGHVSANATAPPDRETWELFNLRNDIGEQHDLSDSQPEILERLRRLLDNYSQQAVAPNIPPNRPPPSFKAPAVWGHSQASAR